MATIINGSDNFNTNDVATDTELASKPIMSGQIGTAMTHPNAPIVVKFNEFWVQQGISHDVSTGKFTVSENGIYRITMNPFFATGSAAGRVYIGKNNLAPNSSTHYGHAYRESATYDTVSINSIIPLTTSDYIVFYLQSGGLYNQSSDRFNQFTIERIA